MFEASDLPDELLMAYVDGELPPAEAERVAARLAVDAAARARAAVFAETKSLVGQAFAAVAREPIPERLVAAARGPAAAPIDRVADLAPAATTSTQVPPAPDRSTTVVAFPPRAAGAAAASTPGGGPRRMALAASIAALIAGGIGFLAGQAGVAPRGGDGLALDLAAPPLLTVLAATPDGASRDAERLTLTVTGTYRMNDGRICRTFEASADARPERALALACREGEAWRLTAVFPVDAADPNALRPAGASNALDAVLDAGGAGEALVGSDVNRLIERGWRP
jgi:hypothetical protein